MPYANNPQAYFNGFISACRNVFLVSSIGIAMYGYSSSFKISSSFNIVRLASSSLFIFALLYGINAVSGMNRYIKELEKSNEPLPSYVQLDIWRNYMYLVGIYVLFLAFLFCIAIRRYINL